jgi:hypothetical protein
MPGKNLMEHVMHPTGSIMYWLPMNGGVSSLTRSSSKLFPMSIPTSITLTNPIIYQMCIYHAPYPRGAIGTPRTWATNHTINSPVVKCELQKLINPSNILFRSFILCHPTLVHLLTISNA